MSDDQRVALVLAGTKGLGYASAEALGATGHQVMICGRDRARVDEAVGRLQAAGVTAAGEVADVTDPAALEALFAALDERFGRLDVLVANAGGPPAGNFDDLTIEQWQQAIELTFLSVVRAVQHALPRMRAAGGGRLIVIGSSSVRRPIPGLTASNALRPGLNGLVTSLAVELAPEGITANMVSPGRIATERTRSLDERKAEQQGVPVEEVTAASTRSIPAGRYGEPGELGAMVAMLAGPGSGYITGQSILIDGGSAATLP